MARYRGTVTGNRSTASRLGHASSGLTVRANGWHSGVEVLARPDQDTQDEDVFMVYGTAGSGYGDGAGLIAEVTKRDGAPVVTHYLPGGRTITVKGNEIIKDWTINREE